MGNKPPITVQIKPVYGNVLIYPVCANAKLFARLTKTKTLSKENLKDIESLGYEVIKQPFTGE